MERQPDICSDTELSESLASLGVAIAAGQRDLLRFVREHDRRRLWERDGCRNMGQWLAGHFGISVFAGMRWTHAAHALEYLPLISAALEAGQISLDKVLQLARFATCETENELLRYARRASLSALRKRADLATRPPLEDFNDDHHARFLEWRKINDTGAIYLEGLLPAADGAIVTKALRRIADGLEETPAPPARESTDDIPDWFDPNDLLSAREVEPASEGLPQKLADALVALASNQIAEDADTDRATVVVSTSLAALQSDELGCDLEGSGVIHADVARRISCDCRLQFVLRERGGHAVGIGHASRNVPGYLRRELFHRDGGCTFPGCGTRRFLDAHHIWHWEAGGPTDLDNLVLVCHFHHKLVHELGWRVDLDEDQIARWFRPGGRRYEPDLRPAGPALLVAS